MLNQTTPFPHEGQLDFNASQRCVDHRPRLIDVVKSRHSSETESSNMTQSMG